MLPVLPSMAIPFFISGEDRMKVLRMSAGPPQTVVDRAS